jgi:dolichol-phosphate mannosyltransferase
MGSIVWQKSSLSSAGCKFNAGEVPLILNYSLKDGESKMKVARTVKGYFSLLAKVR